MKKTIIVTIITLSVTLIPQRVDAGFWSDLINLFRFQPRTEESIPRRPNININIDIAPLEETAEQRPNIDIAPLETTAEQRPPISISRPVVIPSPTQSPTAGIKVIPDQDTTTTDTVPAHPKPRIASPNGGEAFNIGSSITIKYYGGGGDGEKIGFELMNNSTGQTTRIASDIPLSSNSAYYNGTVSGWTIPTTLPEGEYRVTIVSQSNGAVLDMSDATFKLTAMAKGISVWSPSKNELYYTGKPLTVRFSTTGFAPGTTFDIKLGKRELVAYSAIETISPIASNIPNTASYIWNVPSTLTGRDNYLIIICPSGTTSGDCSHSLTFSIVPPVSVPATSPSPTGSPVSQSRRTNIAAAVFYTIGDVLDSVF